jgi:prepilin-type N-terminal cleavage/methylation domain-containing protein
MKTQRAGFSLLELMFVVVATAIVSTVAVIQMKTTITMLDADEAANLVVSQLNYARQTAVDDRRNVSVQFLNTKEIKVTRNESGGGTTVLSDVTLPTAYTFSLPGGRFSRSVPASSRGSAFSRY